MQIDKFQYAASASVVSASQLTQITHVMKSIPCCVCSCTNKCLLLQELSMSRRFCIYIFHAMSQTRSSSLFLHASSMLLLHAYRLPPVFDRLQMQTSELKSSLVCSTSEIQRWISRNFITGLVMLSLAQTHMVQQALLHSHQNHSQLRVSQHKLFREKIAQVLITWLINTERSSDCNLGRAHLFVPLCSIWPCTPCGSSFAFTLRLYLNTPAGHQLRMWAHPAIFRRYTRATSRSWAATLWTSNPCRCSDLTMTHLIWDS